MVLKEDHAYLWPNISSATLIRVLPDYLVKKMNSTGLTGLSTELQSYFPYLEQDGCSKNDNNKVCASAPHHRPGYLIVSWDVKPRLEK